MAQASLNLAGPYGHGDEAAEKPWWPLRHASCSVACMLTRPVCHTDLSVVARLQLLRFAASFVWADLDVADTERRFVLGLARELALDDATARALLDRPPPPQDVDPTRIDPSLADAVRAISLRAIAADGRVHGSEMAMFDLLDELLPRPGERQTP